MSPNAQSELGNATVKHQIDLVKYSNAVVRKIIGLLNRADPDLLAQLTAALAKLSPESFTVKRLDNLLKGMREVNAQAYKVATDSALGEMKDLADYEIGYQGKLFSSLDIEFATDTVTATQAYAGAMARPFQGRLLKEWMSSLEAGRATRIRDAVRMGYVEGQTNDQIVRRIVGTKANKYADGLLDTDRRHAESVVRTAVSHTAGFARDAFYSDNSDIIAAEDWVSTLDNRTTEICRLRDGLRYTQGTHKPIGHSIPWGAGPGKIHFCCRSTSVPILKGMEDEPLFGTRASKDYSGSATGKGKPVKASTTYGDWLKTQPAAVQDDILGPARGKLFRDGNLTLDKFYNDKGQYLTLAQLEAKDAAAFEKAGLGKFKQPTGEFTVYDRGYPTAKPDVSTPARKTAVGLENTIRADDHETGAFIDAEGKILVRKSGQPNQVSFSGADLDGTDGSTFTHNHPANGSFSAQDVGSAIASGLKELRAVGPTLRYTMAPAAGWPSEAELSGFLMSERSGALRAVQDMINRGELEPPNAQAEAEHQLWLAASERFKLGYKREKS